MQVRLPELPAVGVRQESERHHRRRDARTLCELRVAEQLVATEDLEQAPRWTAEPGGMDPAVRPVSV